MLGELDVIGPGPRAAGDRLPSMMSPTLVLESGRPRLALGSRLGAAGGRDRAGGRQRARAWEPVDEAIAAPRLHVDDDDGRERGHAARDTDDLAAAGWNVVRWAGRNLFFGGVSAVELRADGSFDAAGDPRRGGRGVIVS